MDIRKTEIYKNFKAKFDVDIYIEENKKIIKNLPKWKEIKTDLTTNRDNIAIRTGKINDICVIDIDKPKENEIDGLRYFEDNVCPLNKLDTLITKSINGGYHIYFRYTHNLKTSTKIQDNERDVSIDIRNDMGIIFEGNGYNLYKNADILMEVPDKFLKIYKNENERKKMEEKIKNENLSNECLKTILDNLPPCYYDNYQKWFNVLCILKNCGYSEDIARDFSKKSKKYDEAGFIKQWNALEQRENGMKLGTLYFYLKDVGKNRYDHLMRVLKKLTNERIDTKKEIYTTDREVARKFYEKYKKFVIKDNENYYIFNEEFGIWKKEEKCLVSINNFFDILIKEENEILEKKINENDNNIEHHEEFIKCLSSSSKRNSVLTMLNYLFFVNNKNFNNNPYIFPFDNGVWDFKKMCFRKGDYNEFITETTGYDYEYESSIEASEFMKNVIPDKEIRKYVLMIISSYLIDLHQREEFFVFTGRNGKNGKSTLDRILGYVFGNFFYSCKSNLLVSTKKNEGAENASPVLMNMKGKRLVCYNEVSKNVKLNTSFIKSITGGDVINARGLFKNVENFEINAMQLLSCNGMPSFDILDPAILRRLRIIKMVVEFVENPVYVFQRKIKDINVKNLKYSFFQLLIENYNENILKGLEYVPKSIKEDTLNYFNDINPFVKFCEEYIEKSEKDFILKNDLKNYFTDKTLSREYGFYDMKSVNELIEEIERILNVSFEERKWINGKDYRNVLVGYKLI